jgi:hypothetical protein
LAGAAPIKSQGDRTNSQCMAEREEKVKLRFQAALDRRCV